MTGLPPRSSTDALQQLTFRAFQIVECDGVGVRAVGVLSAGSPEDLDHVALGVMEVDADAHPMVERHGYRDATSLGVGAEGPERLQAFDLESDVPALGVGVEGNQRELCLPALIEEDEVAKPGYRACHGDFQAKKLSVEAGELLGILRGYGDVAELDWHCHGLTLLWDSGAICQHSFDMVSNQYALAYYP